MQFAAFSDFVALVGDRYGEPGQPQPETQQSDYEAGVVDLGGERWRIRTARITPKKPGAFVAVWRRDERGETTPFAAKDAASGLMVFAREGERFGAFRFTRADLVRLGVTSSDEQPGKRGFRVYPSWNTGLNASAARTQRAQASAFLLLG